MSTWDCDKCTFINSEDDLTCVMCYQVRASTRSLAYCWQWAPNSSQWVPYDGPSNEQLEAAYQSGQESVGLSEGWFASRKGEYSVKFTYKAAKVTKPPPGGAPTEETAASSSSSSAAPPRLPAFTQLNRHSGMIRPVRRLANDDDGMFVRIPPSQTARGDRCSICAEEWMEEEEDEQQQEGQKDDQQPKEAEKGADSEPASAPAALSATAAAASSSAAPASSSSSSSPAAAGATCLSLYPSDAWPDSSVDNVRLAKCRPGHSFHRQCIAGWIKLKDVCPFCNTKI